MILLLCTALTALSGPPDAGSEVVTSVAKRLLLQFRSLKPTMEFVTKLQKEQRQETEEALSKVKQQLHQADRVFQQLHDTVNRVAPDAASSLRNSLSLLVVEVTQWDPQGNPEEKTTSARDVGCTLSDIASALQSLAAAITQDVPYTDFSASAMNRVKLKRMLEDVAEVARFCQVSIKLHACAEGLGASFDLPTTLPFSVMLTGSLTQYVVTALERYVDICTF